MLSQEEQEAVLEGAKLCLPELARRHTIANICRFISTALLVAVAIFIAIQLTTPRIVYGECIPQTIQFHS